MTRSPRLHSPPGAPFRRNSLRRSVAASMNTNKAFTRSGRNSFNGRSKRWLAVVPAANLTEGLKGALPNLLDILRHAGAILTSIWAQVPGGSSILSICPVESGSRGKPRR